GDYARAAAPQVGGQALPILPPRRGQLLRARHQDRPVVAAPDPVLRRTDGMVREQGPVGRGADEMAFLTRNAEPTAQADRGRHPRFPRFNVLTGGPGSLAERSAATLRLLRRTLMRAMLVGAVMLLACLFGAARADEASAVKAVENLGGKVTRDDKLPGKPVIGVHLHEIGVTDAALKELADLKQLTWLS